MLRFGSLLGVLGLVFVAGCSGYEPESVKSKTYPVRGTVRLADGSPLRGGKVIFHPKDSNTPDAQGIVGHDGKFTLTTFQKDDGAVRGEHTVTVDRQYYDKKGNVQENKSLPIPRKYWNPESSDLRVEVQDKENRVDLKLKG